MDRPTLRLMGTAAALCAWAFLVDANPETPADPPGSLRILAHFSDPSLAPLARAALADGPAEPALAVFKSAANGFRCQSAGPLAPGDPAEGTLILRFPATVSARNAMEALRATGLFAWVEEDGSGSGHGRRGGSDGIRGSSGGMGGGSGLAKAAARPDDPQYGIQYALKNDGSRTFGNIKAKAGADIDAEPAWDLEKGDSDLIVAVLDCGVATAHPELAGRIWKNPKEIPGNGVDDDGDGFIDDVNGWNFAVTQAGGNAMVADDYGHGTNVAGIVGAIAGNGIGVAGVARCKLLPVKVLDSQNQGLYSWWAAGIRYAVDRGARIINMSFGGTNTSYAALKSAVDYALAHNVVLVASMGNERSETPQYPAAFDGVIAVGATGADDKWARSFPWDTTKGSNFGKHISVTAPGNYIYGLDYQNFDDYRSYWSGTSQASPAVAGVCALLLSQGPGLAPADIKRLIESGAEDGVGADSLDAPGWDKYYGFGRLNAYRSLMLIRPVPIRPLASASPPTGIPLPAAYDLLGRVKTAKRRGGFLIVNSVTIPSAAR